jgi:hypothetical protein
MSLTTYYYYPNDDPMVWDNKDEAISWMTKNDEPLDELFETELDWEDWASEQEDQTNLTAPTPDDIMKDEDGEFDHFWCDGTPVFKLMDVDEFEKMESEIEKLKEERDEALEKLKDTIAEDNTLVTELEKENSYLKNEVEISEQQLIGLDAKIKAMGEHSEDYPFNM